MYAGPNAISNAIGYAQLCVLDRNATFFDRSESNLLALGAKDLVLMSSTLPAFKLQECISGLTFTGLLSLILF
jgi:hypothetical protein